jgi:hypothetical protein
MLGCFKKQGCILPVWIMYDKPDVIWMMHGQNKYQKSKVPVHAMKADRRNGSIAPLILYLGHTSHPSHFNP